MEASAIRELLAEAKCGFEVSRSEWRSLYSKHTQSHLYLLAAVPECNQEPLDSINNNKNTQILLSLMLNEDSICLGAWGVQTVFTVITTHNRCCWDSKLMTFSLKFMILVHDGVSLPTQIRQSS